MKDYLRQLIDAIEDTNLARCITREYLQARFLECLQENGAFVNWVFVGGTSLRFLYQMRRFSEDLDFSLASPGIEDSFTELVKKAKASFQAEDYSVSIKAKTEKTVKSAFIKFDGLLFEIGLSPHRSEVISIKVEIDTNPPSGANLQTSIVRRHCLLNLQHYDKGSLLAGKLHALLTRKYVKGRDAYDLMWYLSDRTWPEPNIVLLNNALKQTGFSGAEMTATNWRKEIALKVSEYDWLKVIADVHPFIERQEDLKILTKQNLIKLLNAGS
ncbi:MAG: nucleotidyl transferase AbiEii/AbiGii toxin family protein [Planctomycetes bacterium]|jgi:predicted nucleotidyltransferase component of viral defense system|nr:nucleotidyl transferase AbiEii/AbiGii toxin family protein [Planctomycetota bacterium]MBL7145357.1 nucleotidyl transferase AbiEii/AbiGii toxin family protein [Phycisphaerae bacterium]